MASVRNHLVALQFHLISYSGSSRWASICIKLVPLGELRFPPSSRRISIDHFHFYFFLYGVAIEREKWGTHAHTYAPYVLYCNPARCMCTGAYQPRTSFRISFRNGKMCGMSFSSSFFSVGKYIGGARPIV